jgi:hypothetical protein
MSIVAFDGIRVALSEERWRHIVLRHPELKNEKSLILDAVATPDEVYVDPTGAIHALKHAGGVSDFLVVIYSVNGEGYIRTTHYTSSRRKARRYKLFRRLRPS